jgi:hypothetical protein
MPTSTATARRTGRQRLRSPLAMPGGQHHAGAEPAEDAGSAMPAALPAPRAVTLADFHDYLGGALGMPMSGAGSGMLCAGGSWCVPWRVVVFVGGGTVPMRAYVGPPGISLAEAWRLVRCGDLQVSVRRASGDR